MDAARGLSSGWRNVPRRAASTLGLTLFVFASLLTFPNALPWMVAAWLAWHAALVVRGRRSWLPLACCGLVLLAKNPATLPGLGALLAAMAVACVLICRVESAERKNPQHPRRGSRLATLAIAWTLLAAGWTLFALDWWGIGRARQASLDGRPIVLLGDSLTADMPPEGSYADHLQTLVSPPVINLGVPGITTSKALKILPDVIAARPQVVVVELGGHDFLKNRSREETRANLERIIVEIQAAGAAVVLVETPRALIRDPYRGLERELARRHGLVLVPDTPVRRLVLQNRYSPLDVVFPNSRLSEDGIHPNARGNRLLAEWVAGALRRLYGPAVEKWGV